MRTWVMGVICAAAIGIAVSVTRASAAEPGVNVRIVDGELRALKDHGAARSETFRALLARIDKTPVLVFVECEWFLPTGVGGHLALLTAVDGVRYVRVAIGCGLPLTKRLAMLAHELQHALEIGENQAVTDLDSMESYYESSGFQTSSQNPYPWFETAAAIIIQRRVEHELTIAR